MLAGCWPNGVMLSGNGLPSGNKEFIIVVIIIIIITNVVIGWHTQYSIVNRPNGINIITRQKKLNGFLILLIRVRLL